MDQIDVSIIVPAYNEEKFLPVCLCTLQNQDFQGQYEIIVVDNNSTDETAAVAAGFGVRVVSEINRGVCFARQRGVLAARGKFIISTDADCSFPTDWISKHFAVLNDGIVGSFGPFVFNAPPKWGNFFSRILFDLVRRFYTRLGKIIYVGASNFAFRKDIWEEVGGYNTSLAQGGDEYDLLKRLKTRGQIVFVHDNRVLTSSRRLKKGMFYSLVITFFGYYLLDYVVATYLTGKSMFGHYPAMREHVEHSTFGMIKSFVQHTVIFAASIILIFTLIPPLRLKKAQAEVRARHSLHQMRINAQTAIGRIDPDNNK